MLRTAPGALCLLVAAQVVLTLAAPLDTLEEDFPDAMELDKRGYRYQPVPFPCNGYDNLPRCLHYGKGPRKTWTKSGRFCVCLCPEKWIGPECGYAAETVDKSMF